MRDKNNIPELKGQGRGVSPELAEKIRQRWGVIYPCIDDTTTSLVDERGQAVAEKNQTLPPMQYEGPVPSVPRAKTAQQVDILSETVLDAVLSEEARAAQSAQVMGDNARALLDQIHGEAA